MALPTRSGINIFSCPTKVECGDVLSELWANDLNNSVKALANTGVAAFNGGHQHVTGREIWPLNGWKRGKNFHVLESLTKHMIEVTNVHKHFLLQFEAKIGVESGRVMNFIQFRLNDPTGAIPSQVLFQLQRVPDSAPNEIFSVDNAPVRFRYEGVIDPSLLPSNDNEGRVMDFETRIISSGGSGNSFTKNQDFFWAGVLNCSLKFFNPC